MEYLIIFLVLLFLSYLYDYKKEKRGFNISFYSILFIFILFAGLRYRIGGDTVMYMAYYEKLHPLNAINSADFVNSRFAPGYLLLTTIFKTLTPDFTYFQVFHSLVINCVIFAFVRKNTRHVFFALLIFFLYLYVFLLFEQIRESFAVAIFLIAWPWFKKNIWWKWYIAAFCAIMFHISAFILFFLPLIKLPGIRMLFRFGKHTLYVCLALFIVAFVLQNMFFRYIELISVTESMLDRVQTYGNIQRSDILNFNRIIGVIIQYVAYPIFALVTINARIKAGQIQGNEEYEFRQKSSMALMSIYISIFTIFIGIFVRYNNYFQLFAILLISDWAFTRLYLFKRFLKVGYLYWILIFMPMFVYNFYFSYMTPVNKGETLYNYMRYYPYSSVIDQTIDSDRERTILYIRRKK